MLLFVYPAELLPDGMAAACPSGGMTLVVTCCFLVAEQRGELKFVVCSLLEALL